ncbi:hypothetical protein ACWEQL_20020 [Kitasatospora sp. NPDC004240]
MDDAPNPHEVLTGFLERLTRMLLRTSGEGAEEVERSVVAAAGAPGGRAGLLVVPDGAVVTVDSHGRSSTVAVRAFPEVFRLDQVAALKPLLTDPGAGRVGLASAERRPVEIDAATLVSRGPRRPPRLILLLPGFFTLTVGSLGLRGLTALVGGHPIEGFRDLGRLVTLVVAIAAGPVPGEVLVRRP